MTYKPGHGNIRDSKLGEKRQLHTGFPKWSTKGTVHETCLFLSYIIDILESISVTVKSFSENENCVNIVPFIYMEINHVKLSENLATSFKNSWSYVWVFRSNAVKCYIFSTEKRLTLFYPLNNTTLTEVLNNPWLCHILPNDLIELHILIHL